MARRTDETVSDGLQQIITNLQRQKSDLRHGLDSTDTSSTRTAELLAKLGELRARAESTGNADR